MSTDRQKQSEGCITLYAPVVVNRQSHNNRWS